MQNHSPSFIGIGASFSGLGVITNCLAAHPQVSSTIVAHNFFSTSAFTDKGLAWYEAQFNESKKEVLEGDCSPGYLVTGGTAEKIVTAYPATKLFVVVRNPIDRAIANYEHAKATGKIGRNITCARFLTALPSAQSDGFYGQHLHEYFIYYSPLQLHIIVYEELVENPLKALQALYTFLEIDSSFIPKQLAMYAPPPEEPKHPSKLYRLRRSIKGLIKRYFKKVPAPVFLPAYKQDTYFSSSELQVLRQAYAVDARHLTNLLHRDMGVFWDLETAPTRETIL